MTLDLSTILAIVAGVIALIASMFTRSANQGRKLAEKERDDAQAEAMSANQRVESASAIAEINREKEKKDDEIIHSPVDRTRPFGVWDNSDSDSNTDM